MKIGGVDPKTLPMEDFLVLPRGDKTIVFRACGLPNLDDFHAQVPEPRAPGRLTPQGTVYDTKEPSYVANQAEYFKRRWAFLMVKSLEPSHIEWDTVNMDNPGTWANWSEDLRANGITNVEIGLVRDLVTGVNQLDEAKLKKAREAFLLGPMQESEA